MKLNNSLYQTKFLELKSTKSPNGQSDWIYAHRPNTKQSQSDAVVIAPIIHENDGDSILFLETRRPPIYAEGKAETCIELPAGLVGDEKTGESIKEAALKEILEETGLMPDKVNVSIKNSASSAGCVSETVAFAEAHISNPNMVQESVSDNGVIIKKHKVPVNEVNQWLKKQSDAGKSISSQALAALYCAQAFSA